MAEAKPKTDTVLIRGVFFPGGKVGEVLAELKQLTPEDKKQLAGGIRDGSMNYELPAPE